MSSRGLAGQYVMTGNTQTTQASTTVTAIGVVMFTVSDQDAALAFYTDKLGWEVRGDSRFGENGEYRWLEVAPPGSPINLALSFSMGSEDRPGGGAIGVHTPDVRGEHARLTAVGGIDLDPVSEEVGAPPMFMLRDPDGNVVNVLETH